MEKRVGIIMGSDSDLPIMKAAMEILKPLGIGSEVVIASAHRTPDIVHAFASNAEKRGLKAIIAGAGGAAHLPGVISAYTTLPVIGVPINSMGLNGLDALLSIVQMPPGVPVATMAINGAKNAGIFAAQIIATADEKIAAALQEYKAQMAREVEKKAQLAQQQLGE